MKAKGTCLGCGSNRRRCDCDETEMLRRERDAWRTAAHEWRTRGVDESARLRALLVEARDRLSMLLGASAAGMRAVHDDGARIDRLCDDYDAQGIPTGFGVKAWELIARIEKEIGA